MSVIQSLTASAADTLDTRVIEWIKSSLDSYPDARSLKRVAFVMPIAGKDTMILVNQKNGDTFLITEDIPTAYPHDTLEVNGMFWTYLKAPDGAQDAYATLCLCDTQNLDEHSEALDAVVPETPAPTAEATEPDPLDETLALIETTQPAPKPVVPVGHVTMEELDHMLDAAVAEIHAIGSEIEETSMTADPTTATRRTLTVEDLDPTEPQVATGEASDEQIAQDVLEETSVEQDASEGGSDTDPSTDAASDEQPAPTKTKAPKPTPPTPRERVVGKILDKLGLTQVPSPETVFAKFKNNPAVKWVPLEKLAVFNSFAAFNGNRTLIGRALNALAGDFGGENILNEAAEIMPARVLEVATSILRHGRLVHLPKVAKVDPDTIPESVKTSHEGLDTDVLQVWDGRHRTAGFALLWGSNVLVPVLGEDKTFEEAYDDALVSNDTRQYGKQEAATYFGLTSEIQTGHDVAAAFALCKGAPGDVMKWVVYQTISKLNSNTFASLEVPVYDTVPKGKEGMTTPSYGNIIKSAITVYGKERLKDLETAKPYIDATILTINAAYDYIKQNAPERINNIWTSYGTQVLGKVIGEAVMKAVAAESDYDPAEFAALLMKAVLSLIAVDADKWNNVKASGLYEELRKHATTKGIKLPRVGDKAGSLLKRD